MKKLLALVLALVMTLGLATVSAGAASSYADKNDIDYTEAADVMTAIGVFEGKGENFAPKDNLNRAEAAKLVAYLMLGNKTAEAMKGNGNRFTDVPADHWAVGYIEYLATAGVVSGVGDNKFNPNGQVTAVQFAKMLCVALGYDANVEGYVGDSWNINIMKQANDDKLFDLLNVGSNDALTREQAAQMCLRALQADEVEYESKGDTLTINNSTVVLNAKKAKDKTVTADKGKAIDNDKITTVTALNPYTLQLGEDRYNGDLKKEGTNDDFGRPSNKWIYKNVEIGTYANKSDLVKTYTGDAKRGDLYTVLGSSVYDHLTSGPAATRHANLFYYEDGAEYNGNNKGLVNTNAGVGSGNATTDAYKTEVELFIQKNGDDKINSDKSSGRGTVTEVYLDSDDNVTITVINTYVFKAASDYRASTEDIVVSVPSDAKDQNLNLNNTRLELKDFPEIKDFKKDDYLLITAKKDGAAYKAKTVDKAELLTGKVEQVVVEDSVTIDGEKKQYSKMATDATKQNDFSVGQETTVVLDKYGYIIYVDESVVASNYVFISELYQPTGSTTKVRANAFFTDGTNEEIVIKEAASESNKGTLTGAVATPKAAVAGLVQNNKYIGWYSYSKNSAGEYTLNALSSSYTQGAHELTYTASTPAVMMTKGDTVSFIQSGSEIANRASYKDFDSMSASSVKANDKTIMIVTYGDKNDVDIYTGVKNMPDIQFNGTSGGKGVVFSAVKDGYAKYVFASVEGDYSVYGTENENLLYVIKYDHKNTTNDNKTYYTYKALDENGKEITIEAENVLKNGSSTTYDESNKNVYTSFYKTSKNADGRYTRIDAVPTGTGAKYFNKSNNTAYAISADGNTLTIAGESFTLADNYQLVVVAKGSATAGGAADVLNSKRGLDFEANVMTAEGLEAMVKGYYVTYDVQLKLKDTYLGNGGKVLEGYVTILTATPKDDLTIDIKASGVTLTGVALVSGTTVRNVNLGNVYYVGKDSGSIAVTLTGVTGSMTATLSGNYSFGSPTSSVKEVPATSSLTIYKNGTGDGTLTIK